MCGSAGFADAATDLLLAAGVPIGVDPGGAVRPVRLSRRDIDADTNGSHREHVRVRSTAVAGRRRRAAPSWSAPHLSTRESCMECTGGTRTTVRTAARTAALVGGVALVGVRGRPGPRRRPRAARRRHRGRVLVGADDLRRGAARPHQGVEPRLVARSRLQPAVGQAPVDLRGRAAEPVRQAHGRHGVGRLVHLPRPAPRLRGPARRRRPAPRRSRLPSRSSSPRSASSTP